MNSQHAAIEEKYLTVRTAQMLVAGIVALFSLYSEAFSEYAEIIPRNIWPAHETGNTILSILLENDDRADHMEADWAVANSRVFLHNPC